MPKTLDFIKNLSLKTLDFVKISPFKTLDFNRYKKYLYLDSGLMLRYLGMESGVTEYTRGILTDSAVERVNRGNIVEMVVGLELLRRGDGSVKKELYYWTRNENNSNAEVDYIEVLDGKILPIEVKAGTRGGMKSLYMFMAARSLPRGLRICLENFSTYTKDDLRIDVLPAYAVSKIY